LSNCWLNQNLRLEREPKAASLFNGADHADAAAVRFDGHPGKGKPEPISFACARCFNLTKFFKNPFVVGRINTRPSVSYFDPCSTVLYRNRDRDCSSSRRKLDRVSDKI